MKITLEHERPDGARVVKAEVASDNPMLIMGALHAWFGVTQKPGHANSAWLPWPATTHVTLVHTREGNTETKTVSVGVPKDCTRPRPCIDGAVDLQGYLGASDVAFKARGQLQAPRVFTRKPKEEAKPKAAPEPSPMALLVSKASERAALAGHTPGALCPADPTSRPLRPWPELQVAKAEVPLEPANDPNARVVCAWRNLTWPEWVHAAGYKETMGRLDPKAAKFLFEEWKRGEDPDVYATLTVEIGVLRAAKRAKRAEKVKAASVKARPPVPFHIAIADMMRSRGSF